jgi:hypothetical protein
LNGIPSLGDGLFRLIDCALQSLSGSGYIWTVGEHVNSRLKDDQKPLKTLQERIVQFSGDACSFVHSSLEFLRHLSESQ